MGTVTPPRPRASTGTTVRRVRALLRGTRGDTSWDDLRALLRPRRAALLVIGVLALFVGLAETALLVSLAELAVTLSADRDAVSLELGPLRLPDLAVATVLVIALVLTLGRFVLRVATKVMSSRLTTGVLHELRSETVGLYFGASWSQKSSERSGHLQDVLTTFVERNVAALGTTAQLIAGLGALLVLSFSAFVLDFRLAGLIVVLLVLLFAALRPLSRLVRVFNRRASTANLRFVNFVSQAISQTREIEVFGVREPVTDQARDIDELVVRDRFRAAVLRGTIPDLYQTCAALAIVLGLSVLAASGGGRFAALTAVILLFVRAASYGTQVQSHYQTLQSAVPYIERLREAQTGFADEPLPGGTEPLSQVRELRFEHVTFAYRRHDPALHDVSFQVDRGEMVGIVGPSGAGKSTLVQLLLRLRAPRSGSYLVNGTDAGAISRHDWSHHFALVPQEPTLFAGTIAENIGFFRDRVDQAHIADAAHRAHLDDDLAAMADGLGTWVGDEGRMLSGGQRQRVAIARALAAGPDVIILDEPTSALDLHSESAIQQTLEELRHTTTLFIVAHRLSTLVNCDRIMVFASGHLEAFDTPEQLARSNPFYQRALELARTPGAPSVAS